MGGLPRKGLLGGGVAECVAGLALAMQAGVAGTQRLAVLEADLAFAHRDPDRTGAAQDVEFGTEVGDALIASVERQRTSGVMGDLQRHLAMVEHQVTPVRTEPDRDAGVGVEHELGTVGQGDLAAFALGRRIDLGRDRMRHQERNSHRRSQGRRHRATQTPGRQAQAHGIATAPPAQADHFGAGLHDVGVAQCVKIGPQPRGAIISFGMARRFLQPCHQGGDIAVSERVVEAAHRPLGSRQFDDFDIFAGNGHRLRFTPSDRKTRPAHPTLKRNL